MDMAFGIGIPNLVQIGQRTAEVWRHVDF